MTQLRFSIITIVYAIVSLVSSNLLAQEFDVARPDSHVNTTQDAVAQIIEKGTELEREERWQEAINHYEKASRTLDQQPTIFRRLQISRIHYDIVRRYGDKSFLKAVNTTLPTRSLDLYTEVLHKLQFNYVEPIVLETLIRNGTAFLEVALTEEKFIENNLPGVDPDAIQEFRLNIHKRVLGKNISTTLEARQMVAFVAQAAKNEINLPLSATIHEYVAGSVGLLDPYSVYMTADELNEVMSQIEGNLIGLGVELWAEGDELKIIEVFQGGPAFDAGLKSGDVILAVDSNLVSEISAKRAADLLRGPADSTVRLQLQHPDQRVENIDIRRRRVEVPSVTSVDIVDASIGTGYLRITNFQKTTPREVDQAVSALAARGMTNLIIDLRRNPGGLLDAAVEIADRFIESGGIVSTRGRNGSENRNFTARASQTINLPLVVLIDHDSASASEILAGAISDHDRGVVVGTKSYGKGSVQGLYRTDTTAGGIRLTVSKFFSPSGQAISMHGVLPDVAVDPNRQQISSAKPAIGNDGEVLVNFRNKDQDLALRRAIEVARQIASR